MSKKAQKLASEAATLLGRLAAGKPKNYSPEEIARRTDLLKKARSRRWLGHVTKAERKALKSTGATI